MEDQCVITREVTVAAGVFAPGHLGELTQIVPFEMVDAGAGGDRHDPGRVCGCCRRGWWSTCCWPGACSLSWATGRCGTS